MISFDYASYSFKDIYIKENKNLKIKSYYGSLKNLKPVSFSSSNSHNLFLNEFNELYGFGSNKYNQITSKKLPLVSLPMKIAPEKLKNKKIVEIACGDGYNMILTDKGTIEIFGCVNKTIDNKKVIRGISANGKYFAFAYSTNNVCVCSIHGEKKSYKVNEPVIMTAIAVNKIDGKKKETVAALDQSGNVYILDDEKQVFKKIEDIEKILRISAAHDCISLFKNNCGYVFSNGKLYRFYFPKGFFPIEIAAAFDDVFALSDTGTIAHSILSNSELNTNLENIKSINLTKQIDKTVSYISLNGASCLFIFGAPFHYEYVNIEKAYLKGKNITISGCNGKFIGCTNKRMFLKKIAVPFSRFYINDKSKDKHKNVCYFQGLSTLNFSDSYDIELLISYNLQKGDIFSLNSPLENEVPQVIFKNSLTKYKVIGTSNGKVWVSPLNTSECFGEYLFVINLAPSTFKREVNCIERNGKKLEKLLVHANNIFVDVHSKHYILEYERGDLLCHPTHGIVEYVGYYCDKIVLLDFEKSLLFLEEIIPFKLLRRLIKKKSDIGKYTREVINCDGEFVSLDISMLDGPNIFVPTDRVLSPFGEATLLGFNKVSYIQTDEMRMNGYEAVECSVFDLKLLRRINGVARRKVSIDDDQTIEVSLNTADGKLGLLPNDKILTSQGIATVVGFSGDCIVIQEKGHKNCNILEGEFSLLYRADINAKRETPFFPSLDVGSPINQECFYLPGDIIYNEEIGQCEFLGYNINHAFFLKKPEKYYSFSYSMLMIPNLFKIEKRTVLDFWKE